MNIGMLVVPGSKRVHVQLHPGPGQFLMFLTTKIFSNFFHEVSQLVLPDFPIGYCSATEIEEKKELKLTSFNIFKREKASARASSDRFLPILKPNIQNNAIICTNLGKQ